MRNKVTIAFLGILSIIFALFIFKDWPDTFSVVKDIISMLIILGVATLVASDKTKLTKSKDNVEKNSSYTSDHKVVSILEWFSFIILILFMCIYQFISSNIIVGMVAVIALFYWVFINLLEIIINLLQEFKKSSHY